MKTSLSTIIIIALISGCANRGNPGGGPVDRTPPFVEFTNPASDSTQIGRFIPQIEIAFSERMDEGSLARAIFISPPLKYEVRWSKGKILRLELQDSLSSDRTYVVSIGTDAADEHNNKLKQSYQFAFSTGQNIDRGSISGVVFDLERNERAHIFGFPVRDSLDWKLVNISPLYVTQSGVDGDYSLQYLKPDTYRVLAVLDQNNNLKIDANYEEVGLPFRDVTLNAEHPVFNQLNFQLTRIDTVPPVFSGARAINRNYVQLRFSEPVEVNSDSFFTIIDSLTLDTLTVLGLSRNEESGNIVDVFTENMDSSAYYKAIIHALYDTSGIENRVSKSISFQPKLAVDTTRFVLENLSPGDSTKNFAPDGTISLEFSNPVNWSSVTNHFGLFASDSQSVAGTWKFDTVKNGSFTPKRSLIPDSSYTARLDLGEVVDLWGTALKDSILSNYFTVVSSRELGEISGTVEGFKHSSAPVYLTVRSIDRKNIKKTISVDSTGTFLFINLPEGQYKINGFWDLDENGSYTTGNLFPYKFAEPFFMLDDTIKVRKRWESQGTILHLPDID